MIPKMSHEHRIAVAHLFKAIAARDDIDFPDCEGEWRVASHADEGGGR